MKINLHPYFLNEKRLLSTQTCILLLFSVFFDCTPVTFVLCIKKCTIESIAMMIFKYVLSTMGVSKESISKFFENNITFAWSTKFFKNNIYFRFGKQYLLSLRKAILLSLRKTILLSLLKTILLSLGQKKSSHMPNVFFYLKAFLVKSW